MRGKSIPNDIKSLVGGVNMTGPFRARLPKSVCGKRNVAPGARNVEWCYGFT